MPVGTIYVPVAGTGAAPQTYNTPGASILDLQAVSADFNGSGAGSDFKPAVQLLDSSGHVMATVVGETVTAGGSASVTFAPFLRSPPAAVTPTATNPPTYYASGWAGSAVVNAASNRFIDFGSINIPDGWWTKTSDGAGGFTLDTPADLAQAISWHWLRITIRRTDFGAVDSTKIRVYIWEPIGGQVFSSCSQFDRSKSLVLGTSFGADVSGFVIQNYNMNIYNDDAANSYTLTNVEMRGYRYYYAP